MQMFETPAVMNEFRSQPFEQLRVCRQISARSEVTDGRFTSLDLANLAILFLPYGLFFFRHNSDVFGVADFQFFAKTID